MTRGARVMDSTPPAIAKSISPQRIARAASPTALRPEAHRRLTVMPATLSGKPASNSAMRATLRLSSPAWFAPNERPDRHCREIIGAHLGEDAAIAADRRSHRVADEGVAHRFCSSTPFPACGRGPGRGLLLPPTSSGEGRGGGARGASEPSCYHERCARFERNL